MTEESVAAGYAVSKPTIWYRLGFHYRFDEDLFNWRNEEPKEGDWFVPSALCTHVVVHLGWLDRCKLLITGKAEVISYTRTDVLVKKAVTRSEFCVLPPT